VNGSLRAPSELLITEAPTFDSRNVLPGSIFLALKGEHHDGHDFAQAAIESGAALVLCDRPLDIPCIVVSDVIAALGALAQFVRSQLSDLIVIGITGSQGKTTTKDLLYSILRLKGETVATEASFNNELGLPLTLLKCTALTQYCILEMGARHLGDITALCGIAKPDIGVVLKVGSAHLGEFGTRENIALSKAELVKNLRHGGVAVLGLYDEFTPKMTQGLSIRSVTFGQTHDADVRATDVDIREGRAQFDLVTPEGRSSVALRLVGAHQISNALAAAAVCTELQIPIDVIAVGLSTAEIASKWRMEIHELNNLVLINDAYNANPDSMTGALSTLALMAQERGGQSWAFLGKMHELGPTSQADHADIGKFAESLGIDHLVLISAPEYGADISLGSATSVHTFASQEEAITLWEHFSPGDVVLVKASRAEKLEQLALELMRRWRGLEEKVGDDQ
jgi:UDP-N-acetylmuramoyl-tripeptide--D-alanyl-D-alanine ligase